MPNLQTCVALCQDCPLGGSVGVCGEVGGGSHQEWPPYPRLMVIGEAPGAVEDQTGRPFVGASGELLRKWLKEAGLGSFYLTNKVKHRPINPPNRDPSPKEVKA